jgi:hypothetical protein
VAASVSEYVPVGQGKQKNEDDAPVNTLNVPTGHGRQVLDEFAATVGEK